MRSVNFLTIAVIISGVGWMGGVATAGSIDNTALRDEVRSTHAQAKSERESKQAQLRQFNNQIASLRAQAKAVKEPKVLEQLHAQIAGLREQMGDVMEQLAEHRVAWAEQDVTFAQRRVELAKTRLAKLQSREGQMRR